MSKALRSQPAKRTQIAVTAASVAGVVLLAFAAVDLVWSAIAPLSRPVDQSSRTAGASVSLDANVASLTSRNPFAGAPDAEAAEAFGSFEEDIPVTSVQLVLKGTTATGDDTATALILTPDNKEASYHVGDAIIRGVVLQWVENYRVIITRNGRREQLLLQNRPEIEDKSIPDAEPVEVEMNDVGERAGEPTLAMGQPLKSVAGQFMPVLAANGFAPDDVPLAIDGSPIPEQQQAIEALFDRLKSKSTIMVTVLRDGQEQDITLSLPGGIQP